MTAQELIAYALGAAALVYLVVRYVRRRAAGTCCGEKKCAATDQMARKLERVRR